MPPKKKPARSRSIINTSTRGNKAKQRIATPWPFIYALEQRFGVPVDFDLAAEPQTSKAAPLAAHFTNYANHFTAEDDALKQDWSIIEVPRGRDMVSVKLAYCNPPFAHIKPWAIGPKGNRAAGMLACRWLTRWTVMLVPASASTDWLLELRGKVQIDAIPRIQFEGATHLYPKDLCLIVAGFGVAGEGYWDWRASYVQYCRDRKITPDPIHLKGVGKRFPAGRVLPDYGWTPSPFREARS